MSSTKRSQSNVQAINVVLFWREFSVNTKYFLYVKEKASSISQEAWALLFKKEISLSLLLLVRAVEIWSQLLKGG